MSANETIATARTLFRGASTPLALPNYVDPDGGGVPFDDLDPAEKAALAAALVAHRDFVRTLVDGRLRRLFPGALGVMQVRR